MNFVNRTLAFFIGGIILAGCQSTHSPESQVLPAESPSNIMETASLNLQVTGYPNGGPIPAKFATRGHAYRQAGGGGQNLSIGLKWSAVPEAKSYAFILDDRHPVAHDWVHWLVVDIPASVTEIAEGASRTDAMPAGSRELITSWGRTGYDGPEPPPGSGNHEYVATLFALDVEKLEVANNASRKDFLKAVEPHALVKSSWSGWFERK